MTLSLQKISDSIPAPSLRVIDLFDRSVTTDDVNYKSRCLYACMAIGVSTINTLGYGLVIASRLPTALIYRDFTDITKDCIQDAYHVFNSLYFAAAMSAYLFMSIIQRPGYVLRLEPPIDPYLETPEFKALALEAQDLDLSKIFDAPCRDIPCNTQGSTIKLYTNITETDIEPITDFDSLRKTIKNRPDLVLLVTPDQNSGYLVKRDENIRGLVNQKKLIFYDHPLRDEPSSSTMPTQDMKFQESAISTEEKEIKYQPDPNIIELSTNFTDSIVMVNSLIKESSQPPAPTTFIGNIKTTLKKQFGGQTHIFKDMKYRHIMSQLLQIVSGGDGLACYNAVEKIKANSPLKAQCLELYKIITQPKNFDDIRIQHQTYIKALRDARTLLQENSPIEFKYWIQLLALHRFAGMELYEYCKSLVEEQTGGAFDTPLNLENFAQILERRNKKVGEISPDQGMNVITRLYQRAMGHFNHKDFLLSSNIPYIYAKIQIDEHEVTILRHGTPIEHYDIKGILNVTPDYTAFIEAAKSRDENILHIILEDATPKSKILGGDESGRVKARLELGEKHKNFYTLALRLDGDFVQPKSFKPKNIAQTKIEFLNQMFGENTGYIVPDKLQKEGLSQEQFKGFMDVVCNNFFKGEDTFKTVQEFQAFIVLTYAEIALSLCKTLKIKYLKAFCKDDIDRGGAMKGIMMLRYLYMIGYFHPNLKKKLEDALEMIMVNLVAAPLMVRKDHIIESRANYFLNVIDVMKKVVEKAPTPETSYRGAVTTPSKPHQGLIPLGTTCINETEYQEYLQSVKDKNIDLKTILNQNIVQICSQNKSKEEIRHQFNRDIKGLNMYFNGKLINPSRKEDPEIESRTLTMLEKAGIENGHAWSVLSAFTQTIGSDLLSSIQPLFNNEWLDYKLIPDPHTMLTDKTAGLYLKAENGKAFIMLETLFKVICLSKDTEIAKIRTTIEIPDHREAGAIITTTVE